MRFIVARSQAIGMGSLTSQTAEQRADLDCNMTPIKDLITEQGNNDISGVNLL